MRESDTLVYDCSGYFGRAHILFYFAAMARFLISVITFVCNSKEPDCREGKYKWLMGKYIILYSTKGLEEE